MLCRVLEGAGLLCSCDVNALYRVLEGAGLGEDTGELLIELLIAPELVIELGATDRTGRALERWRGCSRGDTGELLIELLIELSATDRTADRTGSY